MTTPDSRRLDLYAGLSRVLGQREADTLMAYLPREEAVAVATRADLAELEARLGARLDQFDRRIDMVNQRLDRLFLTLGAGLLAIVATLVAGTVSG